MKYLILLALVGFAVAQVQIQIPVQRPQQQPQPPVHWAPQPPRMPQPQPQPPQWQPRADWREGAVDPRCPTVDDHTGNAVLIAGNTANTFFICWGTRAWPFTCPGNSVFRTDAVPGPACADPGWEPSTGNVNNWNNWNNNWNRRPFNGDEEEAEE